MENINFVSVFEAGSLKILEGELKEEYKGILLALKEAIDFSGLSIRTLKLFVREKLLIFDEFETGKILAIMGGRGVDLEKIKDSIFKKIELEKPSEKVIEKKIEEEIFDKAFEITIKYLSAFGEMVFENVLKEMKINKKDCKEKVFRKFVRNLENSAQMIVGPSKAKEMAREIADLIK